MELFKAFGSVFLKGAEDTEDDLDNIDDKGKKTGGTLGKMGSLAKKGAKIMGAAVLGAGAAMIALATKTGNAADRLLDMSSTTGMSTDELQKWEKVATVAGVSADAVSNISEKLTKTMDAMSTGTGKAAEAGEALGLSFEALSAMNADERMNALTEALGKVEDPTKRAKLGTDLLGGSWKEMAPILDVGADRLKGIKDNANIISNDNLNQANEFRIKMDQMKEKAIDFGQGLAVKLIPTLNKLFDWISDNMPKIERVAGEVFENVKKAAAIVWEFVDKNLIPVFINLFVWVKDNMPLIKSIIEVAFEGVKAVVMVLWEVFDKIFLPILKNIFSWINDNMPTIKVVFETVFDAIKIAINVLIDVFQFYWDILTGIFNFVKGSFSGIGGFIKGAFDGVVSFIQGVVDIIDDVVGAIEDAIEAVENFFAAADDDDSDFGGGGGSLGGGGFGDLASDFAPTNPTNKQLLEFGANGLESPNVKTEINNRFEIREFTVREEADIDKVAESLHSKQLETARGNGDR